MQTHPSILFIEKQEHAREAISTLLRRAGYNVIESGSDLDGIEFARKCQFDLFLLDASHLENSGTQLCREIRALHPGTPIFFYQATIQPIMKEKEKPFGPKFVVEANDALMIRTAIARIFFESRLDARQN
jgi:CheY-like chemotaxis protein